MHEKKKKTFKTERQEHFLPLDIHLCHVATKEVKKNIQVNIVNKLY